jgi:aldehyde dehydrogenase (NAD+)
VLIDSLIFEALLVGEGQAFEALRVGPAALDLDLGPLIRASQQQRVWDFLSDAQVAGIAVVAQGQIVEEAPDSGFYQAPTLLRDVPPEHRLAREEIFGPVLCAMPFHDVDLAVQLANGTD